MLIVMQLLKAANSDDNIVGHRLTTTDFKKNFTGRFLGKSVVNTRTHARTHAHTHTRLTALCSGLPGWAGTRKVKPIWILLKQETVSGSGISWAICKSAPRSRQITMPAPHYSSFLQAGCPSCRPTNSVKALKAWALKAWSIQQNKNTFLDILTTNDWHVHTRLMALCLGLPRWAGTTKVKPIWILLEQETVSGSGISWAICKSAPRSRQITMPAPHHTVFYRPDALPAAQPTASKHEKQMGRVSLKHSINI